MTERVVCVRGPPGGGKTTAGRLAAKTLGLEYRSAGELFRAEAARHGMDLVAFSRHAERHSEVDRTLDRAMLELAQPGRLIDGRITGILARREGRPVWCLLVTARESVRAERIARRDGISVEAALRAVRDRERSEVARYRRLYDIDLDREPSDLSVDSSETPAEAVAASLVAFVRAQEPPAP